MLEIDQRFVGAQVLGPVQTPDEIFPPDRHIALSSLFVPLPNFLDPRKCTDPARRLLLVPFGKAMYRFLWLSISANLCDISNYGSIY